MKNKITIFLQVLASLIVISLTAYALTAKFYPEVNSRIIKNFNSIIFKESTSQANNISETKLIAKYKIKRRDVYRNKNLISRTLFWENGFPKTKIDYNKKRKTAESNYNKKGNLIRQISYQVFDDFFRTTIKVNGTPVEVYSKKDVTHYYPDGRIKESETLYDEKYKENVNYEWKNKRECEVSYYGADGKLYAKSLEKYDSNNTCIYVYDLLNKNLEMNLTINYDKFGNKTYQKLDGDFNITTKWDRSYKGKLITSETRYIKKNDNGIFELFGTIAYKYNSKNQLTESSSTFSDGSGSMKKFQYKNNRIEKEEKFDLKGNLVKRTTYKYNSKGLIVEEKTKADKISTKTFEYYDF